MRYLAFYGKDTHFIFIGDSRVRELYVGFVGHLQQQDGVATEPPRELHRNLSHIDNKLKITVEFIWSPDISTVMVDNFRKWQGMKSPPSVVIAGCGLHSIKTSNGSQTVLEEYKVNLTRIVRSIDTLHEKKTRVLWALQQPVNVDKLPLDWSMVSNNKIDQYNKAAIEVNYSLFNHLIVSIFQFNIF